jgi:probable rRNA maturation factor
VEICSRQSALECPTEAIRKALECALREEGKHAELSVALVGDEEMAELNRRFLDRDGPTDVLAFPYGEERGPVNGEIVVNAEMAVRQAAGRPHSATDELMLYVVHGLLHLLGYDDRGAPQARVMRERERAILNAAGHPAAF